ncbi:MAG: transposase family protein [Oscillospiraceae bacterium]
MSKRSSPKWKLRCFYHSIICPDCGGRMHIHGSYRVVLRHLPLGVRLSTVSFEKKRYRCPCCGHTQMQETLCTR